MTSQKSLIVPGEGRWYQHIPSLPPRSVSKKERAKIKQAAQEKRSRGKQLLEQEVALFEQSKKRREHSEERWLENTVLRSGTASDKRAAMIMLVQQNPLVRLSTLDGLLALAAKKARQDSVFSAVAIKELFISSLIPPKRPLKELWDYDLTHPGVTDRHLLYWTFESELKQRYFNFLQIVKSLSFDNLPFVRNSTIKTLFDLVAAVPYEQQHFLLSLLVDKLGDPLKIHSSKAAYFMNLLVTTNRKLLAPLIHEIDALVFRPNVSMKAQYYALIFLNQVMLQQGHTEIPDHLLRIYFGVFKQLNAKDEVESKTLSAILTGIARAIPYASVDDSLYEKEIDALFRIVHITTFNKSVQALLVLHQITELRNDLSDRFFRALYAKLLSPGLYQSSKQKLLLQVIYEALLKESGNYSLVIAILRRLLQVAIHQPPSFACAALLLVSDLMKARPEFRSVLLSDKMDCVKRLQATQKEANAATVTSPSLSTQYDLVKRDPKFSGADTCPIWELSKLQTNFHPSVAKFAQTILLEQDINYISDPIEDFSLTAFLDRFAYRNPKSKVSRRSVMQSKIVPKRFLQAPVNSAQFLSKIKSEADVPDDEVFFYKFFKKKMPQDKSSRDTAEKPESEDSLSDEAIESEDEKVLETMGFDGGDSSGDEQLGDESELESPEGETLEADEEEVDEEVDEEEALMSNFLNDIDEESDGDEGMESAAFANAEEYAELLERSGEPEDHPKQISWEDRTFRQKRKMSSRGAGNANKKKRIKRSTRRPNRKPKKG